mmetsp:Transcript_15442/g.47919  ORF Transcript_15442/g.47919 Transcript_15442/m.47919 type:complete len:316 (-) Transcript_15442:152-1099(-)
MSPLQLEAARARAERAPDQRQPRAAPVRRADAVRVRDGPVSVSLARPRALRRVVPARDGARARLVRGQDVRPEIPRAGRAVLRRRVAPRARVFTRTTRALPRPETGERAHPARRPRDHLRLRPLEAGREPPAPRRAVHVRDARVPRAGDLAGQPRARPRGRLLDARRALLRAHRGRAAVVFQGPKKTIGAHREARPGIETAARPEAQALERRRAVAESAAAPRRDGPARLGPRRGRGQGAQLLPDGRLRPVAGAARGAALRAEELRRGFKTGRGRGLGRREARPRARGGRPSETRHRGPPVQRDIRALRVPPRRR